MSPRALAIRGLFQDAALQVLDNRVFRVLIVLALLPILTTFLIGLNEDSFSFVFGIWEVTYPDWITAFGEDPRNALIELFLELVVNTLAGSIGITVCVAATAFFVPRMLEKGSADLVFTKPISRTTLFLSRYFTGLFFIALLGTFLTFGMYLGVLTASGISYPGILWSTFTLVYIFGLIHGVTMLIGLFTRSTPAAMILGLMFFFGNGCIHSGWQAVDQMTSTDSPIMADAEEPTGWDAVKSGAITTLNTAHYVLPKTTDAQFVVIHVQEALFDSGRTEARLNMTSNLGRPEDDQGNREDRNDPETYFESQFAWDAAEWRYSIWFSVLSSAAFTLLVLGIGCLRIRRIDL